MWVGDRGEDGLEGDVQVSVFFSLVLNLPGGDALESEGRQTDTQ